MNILHVSTARTWRGGEQQLAYLVTELEKGGANIHVFCARSSAMESFCRAQGISCTTFHKRFSFDPFAARQLRNLCRDLGFDLVHAHDSHAHTLVVLAASFWGNRIPAVVSRRVDFPVRGSRSLRKYNHPVVRRIICVSGAIRDVMKPAVHDAERLVVVHSGVDTEKFPSHPDGRLRRELEIPENLPIIANVAALAPHKDYPAFVATVELLVRSGVNAQFVIVGGDGGEGDRVKELIRLKQLEDRILFTGFRDDVPEILPEIDCLLFTSRTEGLGTTLLDAFAAGVPVVATAAGGIPELVRHEQTGLLAPVGDADALADCVVRMLEDDALRADLVTAARRYVEEFTKERTAEKTLDVYRQVLAEAGAVA